MLLRVIVLLARRARCISRRAIPGALVTAPPPNRFPAHSQAAPRLFGRKHPGKVSPPLGRRRHRRPQGRWGSNRPVQTRFGASGARSPAMSERHNGRRFRGHRLFVAGAALATLVGDVGKKIALAQFTAPNGEIVYMAAGKVTGIFNCASRAAQSGEQVGDRHKGRHTADNRAGRCRQAHGGGRYTVP